MERKSKKRFKRMHIECSDPTQPLAEAAANGHLSIVQYLVELGVDTRTAVLRATTTDIVGLSFLYDFPALELARLKKHHNHIPSAAFTNYSNSKMA
tara:strand:+ start:1287 stop:1574 length:288 start_codon:yes stop_codon:yes gene_type:complete